MKSEAKKKRTDTDIAFNVLAVFHLSRLYTVPVSVCCVRLCLEQKKSVRLAIHNTISNAR